MVEVLGDSRLQFSLLLTGRASIQQTIWISGIHIIDGGNITQLHLYDRHRVYWTTACENGEHNPSLHVQTERHHMQTDGTFQKINY